MQQLLLVQGRHCHHRGYLERSFGARKGNSSLSMGLPPVAGEQKDFTLGRVHSMYLRWGKTSSLLKQ